MTSQHPAPRQREGRGRESSGKGKVPHSEWEKIAARRAAGESFAAIARAYDCSPPAIRYIVNRMPGKRGKAAPSKAQLAGQSAARGAGPSQFDDELRQRVGQAISSFLAAFDTSLDDTSSEAFERLLEATDSLMRAAARIRIELERLRSSAQRSAQPS
jgi:hypothetical protein